MNRVRACVLLVSVFGVIAITGCVKESTTKVSKCYPLPEYQITPPSAEVPEQYAKFSGVWEGHWKKDNGENALCGKLVVKRIHPDGKAEIIYNWGTWPEWRIRYGDNSSMTGRIDPAGVLKIFITSGYGTRDITYRVIEDGNALSGMYGTSAAGYFKKKDQ